MASTVAFVSARREGWHFSCEREPIMEKQVHFQSSV